MRPFSLSLKRQRTPEVWSDPIYNMKPLKTVRRQSITNFPLNTADITPANSLRPISVISPSMVSPLAAPTSIPSMEGFRISPQSEAYRSNVYFSPTTVRKIVSQEGIIGVETKREIALYQYLQGKEGSEIYLVPYKAATNAYIVNSAEKIYMNMDKLEGSDLIDYLQANPVLSLSERKQLIINIASALRWYAEKGFLHGDIKFDNLFREENGNIRLLDLGQSLSLIDLYQLPYGGSSRMVRIQQASAVKILREMSLFRNNILRNLLQEYEFTGNLIKIADTSYNTLPEDLHEGLIQYYTAIIQELQGSSGGRRTIRRRKYRNKKIYTRSQRKNRRHQ